MKKETLKKLIDLYIGDDLAEYVESVLEKDADIRHMMDVWHNNGIDIDRDHERKLKNHKNQLRLIRDKCPHYELNSFGVCEVCEYESKRPID